MAGRALAAGRDGKTRGAGRGARVCVWPIISFAPTMTTRACVHCGALEALLCCARCGTVYCGEPCFDAANHGARHAQELSSDEEARAWDEDEHAQRGPFAPSPARDEEATQPLSPLLDPEAPTPNAWQSMPDSPMEDKEEKEDKE